MFNPAMMDPDLMRLAQEQMSRIPPEELAKIQRQMMSNPELLKLATESMKNMRPEDMKSAAEQLKQTRVEDMVEIGEKMAKATPEEIAAMHAHADSQISYKLSAAEMLKKQGNKLHNSGDYNDAAQKYILAKTNLEEIPKFRCGTLRSQCSVNLMSCYLKLGQFKKCIKEGSDVLSYDSNNVKALYRRGQAYKEMGNLEAALSDLKRAHEISPDDETISDVLRMVNEKAREREAHRTVSGGVVIEELVEVEDDQSEESLQCSEEVSGDINSTSELQSNPEAVKLFQNFVSTADPASLASMGGGQMSPEMIKAASEMISKMEPNQLQSMLQTAAAMNSVRTSPNLPHISPEMAQMASERISKMSPDELQKMVEAASSANPVFSSPNARTNVAPHSSTSAEPATARETGTSTMNNIQENMKGMTKDPAMRQMMAEMMKNISPEMMASMSEQFGMKLSKEDATKAQQAMSSLSPEDIDRMMRWAERVQKGVETAKKTKNWLMGPKGLILAICVLIFAFIFHQLGFIGA